jgi:hypothetical protein
MWWFQEKTGKVDDGDHCTPRAGLTMDPKADMTYREQIESMALVECFSPEAFEPDINTPPAVCAFFLSLGVVYNDLKDLVTASTLLSEIAPKSTTEPTAERGELAGLHAHVLRLLGGLIHELLNFVRDHIETTDEPSFRKALKACQKRSRQAWLAIEAAARDRPKNNQLVEALLRIRNKVSFHYDSKEILRAYQAAFRASKLYGTPCLSRGNNMSGSRFYFADATAQQYFLMQAGGLDAGNIFAWDSPIIEQVNLALHDLVLAFVQSRGYAFASVAPAG